MSGARYDDDNGTSSRAADRSANVQLESIGSIGFWLKTNDAGLKVSIAIDDPALEDFDTVSAELGTFRSIIADNQWHKYQWFLEEAAEWDAWVGLSDGDIDNTRISIDSIQITGASDAQVYLDDVFWDPQAVFVPPIPGDFNRNGVVDGADLPLWETGYGLQSGATDSDGDANGDGEVDGEDFLIWQQNLGGGTTLSTTSVPEPTAVVLMNLALSLIPTRYRPAAKKLQ